MIQDGSAQIEGATGGWLIKNSTTIQVADRTGKRPINGPSPNLEFSAVTFTFTAKSSMSTMVFTDESTGGADDQDVVLDNVRIAER